MKVASAEKCVSRSKYEDVDEELATSNGALFGVWLSVRRSVAVLVWLSLERVRFRCRGTGSSVKLTYCRRGSWLVEVSVFDVL